MRFRFTAATNVNVLPPVLLVSDGKVAAGTVPFQALAVGHTRGKKKKILNEKNFASSGEEGGGGQRHMTPVTLPLCDSM